ncbi:MAG: TonB-dependent receptor [Holophagales bacterium]|nr:MAG: TonB-dependent receptor [Holophagales bacterium]
MKGSTYLSHWALALALTGAAATAQQAAPPAAPPPPDEPAGLVEEVLVVTASRTEQHLHDAPVTMSVIDAIEIEKTPADDAGDLLRNVPGLNVAQMSARDIQVSGRESTNSLATGQLVLLDGRSLYLDFFGFVAWDFVPLDFSELKQVEVVRGPGSAVWGANAFSGVINLITKSPKEMVGTRLTLGGGELGTMYGSLSHAGVSGKLGYKLSGAYYEQDPYERPSGVIPGTNPARTYPEFVNQGTAQPKFDIGFDVELDEASNLDFALGYAGTDGIIHTGIGPFDMKKNTALSFGKLDWNRQAMHVGLFYNRLDGEAKNLLTVGPTGAPINFVFKTDTYNLEAGNTNLVGEKLLFTYGANARKNKFDLSIAPRGDARDEYGAYLQGEFMFNDRWRWVIGGRYDNLDPIGGVFSPRTALVFAIEPQQTIRLSYGRAFRAPSVVNNYLQTSIISTLVPPLAPGYPYFPLVTNVTGNEDLVEEKTDAYDLGYLLTKGGTTFSLSIYHNVQKDLADFYQSASYTPQNPPPGWIYPAFLLAVSPLNTLPREFSYRNIGEVINEGLEVGLSWRQRGPWSASANYSYQKDPKITGIPEEELGKAPTHRANVALGWDGGTFFVNANANYQSEAYWADVLSIQGTTDAFTMVNATIGLRLFDGRATLSIIGQNIFDEKLQQHLFGDIISRKVTGQLQFRF